MGSLLMIEVDDDPGTKLILHGRSNDGMRISWKSGRSFSADEFPTEGQVKDCRKAIDKLMARLEQARIDLADIRKHGNVFEHDKSAGAD